MVIEVTFDTTDVYISTTVSPVYVNVSFEAPSGGGGTWGSITGTLSNQTDLQTALDGKFDDPTGTTSQYLRGDGSLATFPSLTGYVPYTGATSDVDLGEYQLRAGQLTLDTSPTGTAAVGTTRWNDTIGSSETTLKGGSVILKNGVDLVARVVNKVSPNTTLTKAAYQAVRVSGAQGQRLAVAFAQANNDANSADTIGLVTETIATNQEGFIICVGHIENINTTGSLQGETWADGDVLYLSPTTAGAITKVKPTGNGHIVVIGYVEYAHANNGKIYVKVMNGWELDELHDVAIVTPLNNEALIYESSSALWKNKSIATALGYTPANAATTLTINGVSYDLSTSRTWSVGSVTGSGASGQVAYWTGASAQSGSNDLFWDNTNGRLGIGTNAPAFRLDINGTARLNGNVTLQNTAGANRSTQLSTSLSSNGLASLLFYPSEGTNVGQSFDIMPRGTGFSSTQKAQFAIWGTDYVANQTNYELLLMRTTGTSYTFESFQGGTGLHRPLLFSAGVSNHLWLYTSGNVGINTSSDGGQRLQVQGDVFIKGSGATSVTTALTVQNSSSQNIFRVLNNGFIRLGNTNSSPLLFPQTNTGTGEDLAGTNLSFYSYTGSQSASSGRYFFGGENLVQTTGANYNIYSRGAFFPTSGTATFADIIINSQINQTGGANGITRGLYVNPTLTAADWRSIEWSNNSGWGLYGAGTAPNFLGGALNVGISTITSRQSGWTTIQNGASFFTSRTSDSYTLIGRNFYIGATGNNILINTDTSSGIEFSSRNLAFLSAPSGTAGGNPSFTQHFQLYGATGNLVLQNGGTFTDSGERLQVTGTMKVTTSGMFGTNTQSSGVKLETDGVFRAWTSVQLGQFGSGVLTVSNYSRSAGATDFFSFDNNSSYTAVAGTYHFLRINNNIAPTSGTASISQLLIQGTINQTGGANGITRGLYVNPTLTAAADFRAIETTNGKVIFGNLPTSSAGLPTGAIWNDAGTIKIV